MREWEKYCVALWNNGDDVNRCNYLVKSTDNSIDRLGSEELDLALNNSKFKKSSGIDASI